MPIFERDGFKIIIHGSEKAIDGAYYHNDQIVEIYFNYVTIIINVSSKHEAKEIFEEYEIVWIYK